MTSVFQFKKIKNMVNSKKIISWSKAKPLIKESDVLLFRGHGLVSWLIQRAGGGVYSHVGIASVHGETLECVEFREFKGGRTVNLETQLSDEGHIDVFRPIPKITQFRVEERAGNIIIKEVEKVFKPYCCSLFMRNLTGLPYGWKRIWLMARHKIPFLRCLVPINQEDAFYMSEIYPVCSTAIAETFERCYVDLVPCKPNVLIEPSDLARSPVLQYLFTIKKDKNVRQTTKL